MEQVLRQLHQFGSDYVVWIVGGLSAHWVEISAKIIGAIAIAALLWFGQSLWMVIRSLYRRWRWSDIYADAYGTWNVYRLSHRTGLIETTIDIRRSWFDERPKCTFATPHISKKPVEFLGYCARETGSLVILLTRYKDPLMHQNRGPLTFGYWLVNEGTPDFSECMVGFVAGQFQGDEIGIGEVIMSRKKLTKAQVVDSITQTKRLNAHAARGLVKKIQGAVI